MSDPQQDHRLSAAHQQARDFLARLGPGVVATVAISIDTGPRSATAVFLGGGDLTAAAPADPQARRRTMERLVGIAGALEGRAILVALAAGLEADAVLHILTRAAEQHAKVTTKAVMPTRTEGV